MKPAPFEYYAPRSIEEALSHLAEHGYDAKILAGGQSLVPMMNFRLVQPSVLVDLNNIPDLGYIRPAESGGLLLGAMTRHRQVEFDVDRFEALLRYDYDKSYLSNDNKKFWYKRT